MNEKCLSNSATAAAPVATVVRLRNIVNSESEPLSRVVSRVYSVFQRRSRSRFRKSRFALVRLATTIIEIQCLATHFRGGKRARCCLPLLLLPPRGKSPAGVGYFFCWRSRSHLLVPFFRGSPDYGRPRFIGWTAVINNER